MTEVIGIDHILNIAASEAALYAEYAPDYWATYLTDPDGIRLEITNYRLERRKRHADLAEHDAL